MYAKVNINMETLNAEGYHIHFYCQPSEIPLCKDIREKLVSELSEIEGAGTVRNTPIGPHPLPMFEAWFETKHLDTVIRWAMENRQGLSVMIHPLSGNDLADHRDHALWLGKQLPLKLDIFD